MAIKIYTRDFPEKIMEQLVNHNVITSKDEPHVIYVNTFLGKVRDTNILTVEKLINWVATRKSKNGEKTVLNFKKIKDITYEEKGLYGIITYHLSKHKTFELKLNRKDGEEFYKLSLELWNK